MYDKGNEGGICLAVTLSTWCTLFTERTNIFT